ncbi:ABC transporter ATP-binding protein [Lampropedia aestuarii]|uniref:ABC transporter ATP-binding protein n=1 Tax=Lampropedia aestuarii TaxID=2562762 RepID=A0A4S5BFM5_9BURK|nr:ABC transporter ATP-binding protein [Lampropedia aestuarii]THJ30809.1 ABC transporter ATP-binding protein [Lampropedia aestuarii]
MIELKGIAKSWGDTTALQAIDLAIAPASFCVLLGPSGCGKSTTLRIIAGLESATSGQVLIDGIDVSHAAPSQRGIAMVFQNYALFPHLSVEGNIGFGLAVRKIPKIKRQQQVHEVAELLGLSALLARKPSQLSGGQQQRVALGRALVAGTKICLMDEPLSNLDAKLRQEMRHELRQLQQQLELTVVYVTHDQAEAMSMADQVVLLNHGRIEQDSPARQMYSAPASTFAARFIGTPPMNVVQLAKGCIAGSDVAVAAPPNAAQLGLRPECVRITQRPHEALCRAQVRALEYLGADLIVHCAIGTQTLSIRAHGAQPAQIGDWLPLHWLDVDRHFFNARGERIAQAMPLAAVAPMAAPELTAAA